MGLKYRSDFHKLERTLQRHKRLPELGKNWAEQSAAALESALKDHLQAQGRGGQGPPLSPMTKYIYRQTGDPTGSGLFDHITLENLRTSGDKFTAIVGIPEGKPTMIAKVQDQGATIPVTEKMRGYLAAALGIYLRAETTHIFVPPRFFWSNSLKVVNRQAKRDIRTILRRRK